MAGISRGFFGAEQDSRTSGLFREASKYRVSRGVIVREVLPGSLVEIRVRQGDVQITGGRTALVSDPTGNVRKEHPRQGLFIYQTRVLGSYRWLMNGKEPTFSCGSNLEQRDWLGYYVQAPGNWRSIPTHENNPLQESVELRIRRMVGEGLREDVQLTNHTQIQTSVHLELEFAPQFIARKEARERRKQFGKLTEKWRRAKAGVWELDMQYAAKHSYSHQGDAGRAAFRRGLTLRIETSGKPRYAKNRIGFRVRLEPHARWRCRLSWLASVDGKLLPLAGDSSRTGGEWEEARKSFERTAADFEFSACDDLEAIASATIRRSRMDISALRLHDLEKKGEVALAAGVPTYMGVFGRDMLASAWQASLLGKELLVGSLDVIGSHQAKETDDWRDAQPGRIVHEVHMDPLSVLNFWPKRSYYGSVSSSFLYPILVSDLWHWTGDLNTVRRFVPTALRALQWADEYSLDETGFYRYKTRSKQGMKNQGWKDSGDAIVYPDGSQVSAPIGTCEMQAFVYAAKLHFSEVLWWLGEKGKAERLFAEARDLKERFNQKFWMEDEGYFAMGIDARGELIRSVASDPGHCLLSGIVEEERVERVAARMLKQDLFSGWGVRTLSAEHPAYNPFSYHRGSVWPVENGGFVLAFARYGLHGEVWQLARAMFEAAALFPHHRLPEVFGGHARNEETPFPGLYTRADWPQAWSASAPLTILQAMLGLYPYAPASVLFVDPHLPEWLPQVKLRNLKVGNAEISLGFKRNRDGNSDYEILELDGSLHVLRQPSPWSLTTNWAERLKDLVLGMIPGH